jgi:hypothetical protein
MQILRFDESEVPAPKRKSASKGWLALGLVATMMGVGTAFASSTITIPTVSLGQGVAQVTNCDPNVSVSPEATGSVLVDGETSTPVFRTTSIGISDIANECSGVDFGVQVFKKYNNSESGNDDYQNPNVRHDGYAISAIECARLNENSVLLSTDPSLSVKCATGTNTIWVHLPSGITDNAYAFNIILNATNDIDYVTLVSSAHNDSRFL